ncbi:hypothetical protein BD311DRAFT_790002 [Dichomitus squalens]|uniref:Uncharacterized protein n=1 Tax=Dichomitus squalens TaxID=114155 RepID=A0A4Q9MGY4_9APHY|nr:hypothetical protein BD311DRAFT_790002 [Dichomitus squalens]
MDVTPDPRPLTPPPVPLPPPTRPSPPSASAFDKVLGKLAALRREALLLTRRRRPDKLLAASSPRPANAARGPLSYADAARGASKSGGTVFIFNVSGRRGGAKWARGVGQQVA